MAVAKVYTGTIVGLKPIPITVEVNIESRGFPAFNIVGLASKEVEESKLRIRSAIFNSDLDFPTKDKITVNLAPANIPKEGSLYDLPIALGILKATGQIDEGILDNSLFMGELSLDASIKGVNGIAVIGDLANPKQFKYVYIPKDNEAELALVSKKVTKRSVNSLAEVVYHLKGVNLIYPSKHKNISFEPNYDILLEDIQEQTQAKRAITIAAAGGHNVALSGPPGTGKSMLAKGMQSILPGLTRKEAKEVMRIKSIIGEVDENYLNRPFRSPHHTISRVGMIGGGTKIKPGEITLSHRGVLFLDELNEFPRSVIESLRQPLEDRKVNISRAKGNYTFPASFSLIIANNPCPCGYLNSNIRECNCKIGDIKRYQKRISGPMWDRIDIFVTMKEFNVKDIKLTQKDKNYGDYTKKVKQSVEKAREVQKTRYKNNTYKTNAEQPNKVILELANITKTAKNTLDFSVEKFGISPRGYFRVIKVARTIADLDSSTKVKEKHILEALTYRNNQGNNIEF